MSLASALAQHVLPLFTPLPDAQFVDLQDCMQLLPRKPMSASFPCATQDGGGSSACQIGPRHSQERMIFYVKYATNYMVRGAHLAVRFRAEIEN